MKLHLSNFQEPAAKLLKQDDAPDKAGTAPVKLPNTIRSARSWVSGLRGTLVISGRNYHLCPSKYGRPMDNISSPLQAIYHQTGIFYAPFRLMADITDVDSGCKKVGIVGIEHFRR